MEGAVWKPSSTSRRFVTLEYHQKLLGIMFEKSSTDLRGGLGMHNLAVLHPFLVATSLNQRRITQGRHLDPLLLPVLVEPLWFLLSSLETLLHLSKSTKKLLGLSYVRNLEFLILPVGRSQAPVVHPWMLLLSNSSKPLGQLLLPPPRFRLQYLRSLLIWPSSLKLNHLTNIYTKPGNCDRFLAPKKLLSPLLISCNANISKNPSLGRFGERLFGMNMSISSVFLVRPTGTTVIRMTIKNLRGALCSPIRNRFTTENFFGLRLNGLVFTLLGRPVFFFFTLTDNLSFRSIIYWLLSFSELLLTTPVWLYTSISKLGIAMLGLRIIWMNGINCTYLFWCNYFVGHLLATSMIWNHLQLLLHVLRFLARTGVLSSVMTLVLIEESMECVQSVERNTDQKTLRVGMPVCKKGGEELLQELALAEVGAAGPRCFQSSCKRRTEDLILGPRFRRQYVWSNSHSSRSPAALDTEYVEPFPSPLLISLTTRPSS